MINSAVSLGQLQHQLDTTGNNIANSGTTGFKRSEVTFRDLLTQQVNNQSADEYEVGRQTPNGIRVGSGSAVDQINKQMEQGSIQQTDRELDIALTEEGHFFELAPDEDGERRFTRDGAFYFSPNPDNEDESFIVNQNGEYVESVEGGPIAVPNNYEEFSISSNGTIEVTVADEDGETEAEDLGQLQLVEITRPELLEANSENVLQFADLDELELGIGDVLEEAAGTDIFQQGALEMSNVDLGKEMTDMLNAQRAYQFNSRALEMTDEMQGLVNNLR
nr:flagellar hook-basal body protein [Texcoconibacillus texcoconensis]